MERTLTVKVTIDESALDAYILNDPTEDWASLRHPDKVALRKWLNDYATTAYDDVVILEFVH